MSSANSSNLPRLRSAGSNASLSNATDLRPTRSLKQNENHPPESSKPTSTIVTRSRFGFASSNSATANIETNVPLRNLPTTDNCTFKSSRASSSSSSETARPLSALARPATALGTRSGSVLQPNSRLLLSTNIPAPIRKRRTSSVSSQQPLDGRTSKFTLTDNHDTSTPSAPLPAELEKELAEALVKLNCAQEECDQWKTRLEEAESRLERSEKDQHDQRISFAEEIQKLDQQHAESLRATKEGFDTQLSQSQSQLKHLQAMNLSLQQELDQKAATIDDLQTEIEQMDVDSGRSAAQVMELTHLKTDLEANLQAVQSELKQTVCENDKRIDEITQHYHNIQSKLHQDLEQITADYQASLQQQSLSSGPGTTEKLRSRISQLEKQIFSHANESLKYKAEIDRLSHLAVIHEEDKREWNLVREKLNQKLQALTSQKLILHCVDSDDGKVLPLKAEDDISREEQLIEFTTLIDACQSEISVGNIDEKSLQTPNKTDSRNHIERSFLGSINGLHGSPSQPIALQELEPERDLEPEGLSLPEQLKSSLVMSSIQPASSIQTTSDVVPRELHETTLSNLKNLEEELASLKNELNSAQEALTNLHNSRSQTEQAEFSRLEHELSLAQEAFTSLQSRHSEAEQAQLASQNELESLKNELQAQLTSSQQTIDELKSTTIAPDIHNNLVLDLENLKSEILNLKAELNSAQQKISNLNFSQEAVTTLELNLDNLKKGSAQEIDRLSEAHAKQNQQYAQRITQLEVELDRVNGLYAQAASKLKELEAFNPQQIIVLTSRLREERDQSRRAVEFLGVERQIIEDAARKDISTLQTEQRRTLDEATVERNALIITILNLRQAFRSLKQASASAFAKLEESDVSEVSPKTDKSIIKHDADRTLANYSLASHLRADFGFGPDDSLEESKLSQQEQKLENSANCSLASHLRGDLGYDDVGVCKHTQAYEAALEQIISLTNQVDDIREQLLRAHVVHQEEEKVALQEVENFRNRCFLAEEQRSRMEAEKTKIISSLELSLVGIQHQFQSLESSYGDLRKKNAELNEMLTDQHEISSRVEKANETLQRDAHHLRSQTESMNDNLQNHRKQITNLQEQLFAMQEASATASKQSDLASEAIKAGTESLQLETMDYEIQGHNKQSSDLQEQPAVGPKFSNMISEQSGLTSQSAATVINDLRSQIESMEKDIEAYQKQIEVLQEQLSLSNKTLAALSDKQEQLSLTEVELAHDLSLQMKLVDFTKQLEEAHLLHKNHIETIERLEKSLVVQELDSHSDLGRKEVELNTQKQDFDNQLSKLVGSLDSKSSRIVELEKEANESTKRLEDEHNKHKLIQDEATGKLTDAINKLGEMTELTRLLESRIEDLENVKTSQGFAHRAELERMEIELTTQKQGFEEQLSNLVNSSDSKSSRIADLEKEVHELTTRTEDEYTKHDKTLDEVAGKLTQAINAREEMAESNRLLESKRDEFLEKVATLESENEILSQKLQTASEEEHVLKTKMSIELSQTKEELAEVKCSRDLMSEQLDQMSQNAKLSSEEPDRLKSEQGIQGVLIEQQEALLSDLRETETKLTAELESLRSQYNEAKTVIEDLKLELKDKDSMIDSLKADLATVSKLHRTSSVDPTDRMKELEERAKSKAVEAEDALDRLLDEMQKNKRLSNLVETLKMKLKSKSKSVDSPGAEANPGAGEVEPGVVTSSSVHETSGRPEIGNHRKRKHETHVSSTARLQTEVNVEDQNKENSYVCHGRQPVRRKIGPIEPVVIVTEETITNNTIKHKSNIVDEDLNNLGILQPIQVNQPRIAPTELEKSEKSNPKSTSTGTTNSNLLASIQSLRRKQQRRQQPNIGKLSTTSNDKPTTESRRSSLRLMRKDQEIS